MSDIRYHIAPVENQKDSYEAYDILDFVVSFENRKLNCNNIRLLAEVEILDAGVTDPNNPNKHVEVNKKTFIDGLVGGHSFIGSLACQTMNQGSVETIQDYPKVVSVLARSTVTESDMFNSHRLCEIRTPSETVSNLLIKGTVQSPSDIYVAGRNTDTDMSLVLLTCFNSAVNDYLLPYTVTGDIRYTIQLPSELGVMWGDSTIGGLIKYRLKNVRLSYQSFDDDGKRSPSYVFGVKGTIHSTVQSNNSNFSTKYPMVCSSVVSTFTPQAEDTSNQYNSLKCHQLPSVDRVEYLFNDSSNSLITYALDNPQDILQNFVDALGVGADDKSDLTLSNIANNQAWGLGVKFPQPVDLNSQKLSINLYSAVNNLYPYTMYTMFFGMITL
jgi:hypothetical protein